MMTALRTTMVLAVGAMLLGGCSEVRETFVPSKKSPDEFAVYTRAPLSLPPDYALRVPEPGAERPQNVNPEDTARQVTIGLVEQSAAAPDAGTPGLTELMARTGANEAEPGIRKLVNDETSVLAAEDDSVVDELLFWKAQTDYGVEVDPTAETKRIQEKQALGEPITTGDVPTIERGQKGLLEDLF